MSTVSTFIGDLHIGKSDRISFKKVLEVFLFFFSWLTACCLNQVWKKASIPTLMFKLTLTHQAQHTEQAKNMQYVFSIHLHFSQSRVNRKNELSERRLKILYRWVILHVARSHSWSIKPYACCAGSLHWIWQSKRQFISRVISGADQGTRLFE